jgi:hypothetical protein
MKHLRKFNESFEDETKSYIETLFADISDSGYYDVSVIVVKSTAEIKLEPIEGRLWNRPSGQLIIGFCETSIEDELEILKVEQRTLHSINAIIKDIESEGNEVIFYTNRLGVLKINIEYK